MADVTKPVRLVLKALTPLSPRLAGRFALFLFGYPMRRAKVRDKERALLATARVETITVAGYQVVTYAWGDGTRPVLLLHGWESRGTRYAPVISQLLDRGFSPVTFDAPGHGDSSGRTAHVLDYEKIARAMQDRHGAFEAVVAHSIAAMYVFHVLRNGVASKCLVTIAGPSRFDYPADRFAEHFQLAPKVRADMRRRMEEALGPGDIWERYSPSHQPSALPIPLLVVHDTDDPVIGYDQAELLVKAYEPRARLLTTRGLGHHRILSAPEVVQAVVDFVTDPDS